MKHFAYIQNNIARQVMSTGDPEATADGYPAPAGAQWLEVTAPLPSRGDIYNPADQTFSTPTPIPSYGPAISKIEFVEKFNPGEFSRWVSYTTAGTLPTLSFPVGALTAQGSPTTWTEVELRQKLSEVKQWMDYAGEIRVGHPYAQSGLFVLAVGGILDSAARIAEISG